MFDRKHSKTTLVLMLTGLVVGSAFGLLTRNVLLADTGTKLHITNLAIGHIDTGGPKRLAYAAVHVEDELGNRINGAVVEGNWSGCFIYADSATTQTFTYPDGTVVDGRAEIWANKSNSCWGQPVKCSWIFTVTNISKSGMTYDPAANIKTTASGQCQ